MSETLIAYPDHPAYGEKAGKTYTRAADGTETEVTVDAPPAPPAVQALPAPAPEPTPIPDPAPEAPTGRVDTAELAAFVDDITPEQKAALSALLDNVDPAVDTDAPTV